MTTKKFWCHYIGSDGNTPKRRNIELTNLADLIPAIGDNTHCETPVWYEKEEDEYHQVYYWLYAQLSDKVAVKIMGGGLNPWRVERLQKTDEQIEADAKEQLDKFFAEYPNMTEERKAEEREYRKKNAEQEKENRKRDLDALTKLQNYAVFILSGSEWISGATINAFEEVKSPYLPVMQELRRMRLAKREEDRKRRKEEERKREEEEAKRKAEEEAKEQERLTQEAVKFKNGESISGDDVVDLCRRYGINIHLRTVHNLQQVVTEINGKEGRCSYHQYGKRSPKLDGCFKTAAQLYYYLQHHDAASPPRRLSRFKSA